jgi:hypothetical protein
MVAAYREAVRQRGAADLRSLQRDDTNLPYLCDLVMRARAAVRGEDPIRCRVTTRG